MTKYGPEAKDLWIQARIDELLCDNLWCIEMSEKFSKSWVSDFDKYMEIAAKQQAAIEHAEIEAMILDAQIDNLEMK